MLTRHFMECGSYSYLDDEMRYIFSLLFFSLVVNDSHSQINGHITRDGIVDIEQIESQHYLFTHPRTWKNIQRDTSNFYKHTFKYHPHHLSNDGKKPFPMATFVRNFDIEDSSKNTVKVSGTYWCGHYHSDCQCMVDVKLNYRRNNTLKRVHLVSSASNDKKSNCSNLNMLWRYYYTNKGIRKIKKGLRTYIKYDRLSDGKLNYYMRGSSKLDPIEIYDSLNNELKNETSEMFSYSDLEQFTMFKYDGDRISEYLSFQNFWPVCKVELKYDEQDRLIFISELWEEDKNYRSTVEFSYDSLTNKVVRVTRIDFVENWENIVRDKAIVEYFYKNGSVDHIIKSDWSGNKWDNEYYDQPAADSRKIEFN